METTFPDRRRTVAQLVAGYEPTASNTMLLLGSCMADFGNNKLVVVSAGDITDEDWAVVMETFPIHNEDYNYDFAIHEGFHVIVITDWSR